MSKLTINLKEYSHISVKNNRVMVKVIPIDYNQSSGGIILNKENKTTFLQGVVVALGTGRVLPDGSYAPVSNEYAIGDVIYFSDMAGVDFMLTREEGVFEDVKVVDCDSVYFVDGVAKAIYVTE